MRRAICLQDHTSVVYYYTMVRCFMKWMIRAGRFCLSALYGIMKVFPTKFDKVLFLSRQSDELSLDFCMLKEELQKRRSRIEIKAVCNRLDDSGSGILGFAVDTLRSMYHLATSRVCVLDAYWPAVSLLRHKEQLTVIQMWHALGKIKKSGYQTLDKASGRSGEMARLLCMHRNYDYIVAGGRAWNPYYCQSFDTTEDKLLNIGLPRIDYLLETEEENRRAATEAYPQLDEKQVILYAPTFRRNIELNWQKLLEEIDFRKYILIVKGHPNQEIRLEREGVLLCPEFSAVELLAVCDYLITDYSAIAVEAAVLNKKTYYYLYDYEEYAEKNGINVNPFISMPGCAFKDARSLVASLESGEYNQQALDRYRTEYLPEELGTSTRKLANVVVENLS